MRTTGQLEANNRVLNDNVVNHGNFFTFAHDLRLEDFLSYTKFKEHAGNGYRSKDARDKYKVC